MAPKDKFIVVDVGSTSVHLAEFETPPGSPLILLAFDSVEYAEAMSEQNRTEIITDAISAALETGKFTSRIANVCISGQSAFMRFVKLPPVTDDESSVKQIIEFEAKQNVPFPIDEVIWDYQLIGDEDDADELEVMFAVIKNDIVESIIAAVKAAGLKAKVVDFSPAALFNAACANYVGENDCEMLLNIGGKCTTLLFMEKGKFFARSIPIAGAAITQQIAKEFSVPVDEAETLKRRFGFVSLGGAYEDPESEVAATISKIVRNVMTRLHGEINRTINIYRSQQKGSKPTRLLLSGGSSTMAFTDTFFSEKLRMEVNYFNAFPIVNCSTVDTAELEQVAHLLPETVGVALRETKNCPVEINLSTADVRGDDSISRRLPYIIGSCISLLSILGILTLVNFREAGNIETAFKLLNQKQEKISLQVKEFKSYIRLEENIEEEYK
ncbi:MAG: pilus assembly protein PilM, partial [Lentisphaeria bacterium]|nr:pilus assembly protein PilM [Lentisphaeria bacterium]